VLWCDGGAVLLGPCVLVRIHAGVLLPLRVHAAAECTRCWYTQRRCARTAAARALAAPVARRGTARARGHKGATWQRSAEVLPGRHGIRPGGGRHVGAGPAFLCCAAWRGGPGQRRGAGVQRGRAGRQDGTDVWRWRGAAGGVQVVACS
jgi:hypothetical protein